MRSSLVFWGRTKNSKGVALMITLFISVIVFIIMTGLLLYTRREYQVSGGGLAAVKAQYTAEAGVEYFMAKLQKEIADNPSSYKFYYFPASDIDLYDAGDLTRSVWEVPAGSPYDSDFEAGYTGIYRNLYGNFDDAGWRWVFRYTGDINNLIGADKELSADQKFTITAQPKTAADGSINPQGVEPFISPQRPDTWWQDQPYMIESTGKVGINSIVSQRTYKSEVRYFSQRKPFNFYYKVDY